LVDDARLTLATIQSAYQHGALVANYAQVSGLLKENGKVSGIQVLDRLSGETFTVRARATVNATGVWVDQVRHMDDSDAEEIISSALTTTEPYMRYHGKKPALWAQQTLTTRGIWTR
jgi:glycerol-3-phosphate dehydrogenase